MGDIIASIRHNLGHVLNLSGRQPRGLFWPYAIFLYLLSAVVAFLLMVPAMFAMLIRVQRYVIEHPEGLPVDSKPFGQGAPMLPPELMADFSGMMTVIGLANVALGLLLAAAIVRRLHDCARTGWWALLPLPSMILGQIYAPAFSAMFTTGRLETGTFRLLMLNGLIGWATIIALIVLLAQDGTEGPNRFGPDPKLVPPAP